MKKKIPYAASPLYLFGETVVKVGCLIKNDKERKIVQKNETVVMVRHSSRNDKKEKKK